MTRFALRIDNGGVEAALKQARQMGLDALEISWKQLNESAQGLLVAARRSALQVATVDLGALPDPSAVLDDLEQVVSFSESVSNRRLTLTGPDVSSGQRDEALDVFVEGLRRLADQTEPLGIAVVVRCADPDEAEESLLSSTADLRLVLARANRGNVSAQANLAAMLRVGEDPSDSTADLVGRLGHASLGTALVRSDAAVVQQFLADLSAYGYADVVSVDGPTNEVAALVDAAGGSYKADADRLAAVQKFLVDEGLDAAVLNMSKNIVALSGYWPMNGTVLAFVPAGAEPHLFVPAGEETWASRSGWANIHVYQAGRIVDPTLAESMGQALTKLVDQHQIRGGRLAIEGPVRAQVPPHMAHEVSGRHESLRPVVAEAFGAEPEYLSARWTQMRAAKTEQELRAIRRSAAIADVGLRTFRDGLAAGVRDIDLATAVESAIETFGVGYQEVSRVRSYAFVMGGEQTSQTHLDYEFSSTRRQRTGDNVLMELAVVADGYWQDLSRAFVIGAPTAEQQHIYDVAEAAFQAAVASAVPGATGHEVDLAARQVIDDAGMAEAYPHQTGHGVGVAFHEQYPLIKPGSDHVLEHGHVIAIEPGVYIPGVGGVRNEDNLVVGPASGARTLQSIPHAVSVGD